MAEGAYHELAVNVQDRQDRLRVQRSLGADGIRARVQELAGSPDQEGGRRSAAALEWKVGFMATYAEALVRNWIHSPRVLREEEAWLEQKIKSFAANEREKSFLMALAGDAETVKEGLIGLNVRPNPENVCQLALALDVVKGAMARGGSLSVQDVQEYRQLQEAAGKMARGEKPVEAKVAVPNSGLEPLRDGNEQRLAEGIRTALTRRRGFGFLHNRNEIPQFDIQLADSYGRSEHQTINSGLQNRKPANIGFTEAEQVKDFLDFTFRNNLASNRTPGLEETAGEVSVAIADPSVAKRAYQGKAIQVNIPTGDLLVRVAYRIDGGDTSGRSGNWAMYACLPAEVARALFRESLKHRDDPAFAVRVLGHALGETLETGATNQFKFAKLDARKLVPKKVG